MKISTCLEELLQGLYLKKGLKNKGAYGGFTERERFRRKKKHRATDEKSMITMMAKGQVQCSGS